MCSSLILVLINIMYLRLIFVISCTQSSLISTATYISFHYGNVSQLIFPFILANISDIFYDFFTMTRIAINILYIFWYTNARISLSQISVGGFVQLQYVIRRRQRHPTPGVLPGKSHGRRSLVGCSPWGRQESDTTERLHFHFSLSCIGEGNGNPLQCSWLENPRDGGACWAAVSGVAQSQTRLKRHSSSSSSSSMSLFNFTKQYYIVS